MGIFNITWATGKVEQVIQSDCHDISMFLNTKFGGNTTVESLADNGVKVEQVIEHSVFKQLIHGAHDVVQRVENEFEKIEDKVEHALGIKDDDDTKHLLASDANKAHLDSSIGQLQAGQTTQRELIEDPAPATDLPPATTSVDANPGSEAPAPAADAKPADPVV